MSSAGRPSLSPVRLARSALRRARKGWRDARRERAVTVPHRWWRPCPDMTGREVCLFVTYAPTGRVPAHALYHARAWRAQGLVVVLVICLDALDGLVADQPLGGVDAVLLRANRGYDFGAWATAIALVPGLRRAARVVTANDSVYGPLDGFPALVARLRDTPADVVGVIESLEYRRHFQSFLLAFGPRALSSRAFRRFWHGVRVGDRQWVIDRYELRLLDRLTRAGLSALALFPAAAGDRNPTLQGWRALIERGFPFIKVQLLRDNPYGVDIDGWPAVMARRGYDPALAEAHLGRVAAR